VFFLLFVLSYFLSMLVCDVEVSQLLCVCVRRWAQFVHLVFDDVVGRGVGYQQFGTAQELSPVVTTWKQFLTLAVGLQLTSEQVRLVVSGPVSVWVM
jgi:hypothetical protein